jgi:hypothetical protein
VAFAEEPAVVVGAQGNKGRIEGATETEASRLEFLLFVMTRTARRHDNGTNTRLEEVKRVKKVTWFFFSSFWSKRVISEMAPTK